MALTLGGPVSSLVRPRLSYLSLAIATIALGLILQWFRLRLPASFADILGDALWGLMVYWLVGMASPHARRLPRAAIALLICWIVELSQLYHAPWLDTLRATTLGHLVLGSGFDLRDLAAYGLGVLGGLRLEPVLLRRRPSSSTQAA